MSGKQLNDSFKPKHYPSNLASLQSRNPAVAELVESFRISLETNKEHVARPKKKKINSKFSTSANPTEGMKELSFFNEIEPMTGKRGFPTVALRGRLLHSKLDPEREAKRIVDQAVDPSAHMHVFYGFGYGYHLEEYLHRFSDTHLVVIEKHPSILFYAMIHRELTGLLADHRLHIMIDPSPEELRAQRAAPPP